MMTKGFPTDNLGGTKEPEGTFREVLIFNYLTHLIVLHVQSTIMYYKVQLYKTYYVPHRPSSSARLRDDHYCLPDVLTERVFVLSD